MNRSFGSMIKVGNVSYDIQRISDEELAGVKYALDSEIADITFQLETAAANFTATGERADTQWFLSARRVKRLKGQQSQMIQAELGSRKRRRSRPLSDYFMVAAQKMLDEQTYTVILDEAHDQRKAFEIT